MIQEIKLSIVKEVERLGYLIDEKNVIYDSRTNSKYAKLVLVVSKNAAPLFVFEYDPEKKFLKLI